MKVSTEDIDKIIKDDLLELLNPKIIYKYSNFDVSINNILHRQTLRFVNPSSFNDPFDCNEHTIKIHIDNDFVPKMIRESHPDITEEFETKILSKLKLPQTWAESFLKHKQEFKITCFSKKNDNVLMWSHYADKHNGICIGFDFPYMYNEKFILSNVKYLDKILPVCGKAEFLKVINYWLTTKSSVWEYENEVRALLRDDESNEKLITFDKKYIKEIIFGCNVTAKAISNAIINLQQSTLDLNSISIKKAVINKNSFALDLVYI